MSVNPGQLFMGETTPFALLVGNHASSSIWGDPKTGLAPQDRCGLPKTTLSSKSKIQNPKSDDSHLYSI